MKEEKTTAAILKELRESAGLTQRQAAEIAGVNIRNYSAWENGVTVKGADGKPQIKQPDIKSSHIAALAQYYGVSSDYILGLSPYKAAHGADIAKITGLSDSAIQILQRYNSGSYTAAGDVSRLLLDYERHGKNSLLSALHEYVQVEADTMLSVNPNTGRAATGLYTHDIPLSGALLYAAVAALDQFKSDQKKVSV